MATIPYNLIVKENNSDKFYNVLSEVTSIVTHRADQKFALELDKFIAYIESTRLETLRLRREYLIEMVLIGSLWNRYISNALGANFVITKFAQALAGLRQEKPEIKPEIDQLKASLLNDYLLKHSDEEATPDLVNYKLLLDWLASTGEFKEEVIRLENWEQYFATLDELEVKSVITDMTEFADEFAEVVYPYLHEFTAGLFDFYDYSCSENSKREDIILRERTEEEYHLNMVCSQILNDAYRSEFKQTKEKVVLLPTCMNLNPFDCKAVSDGEHKYCTACDANCHVGQIKSAINGSAKIALIPHSSGFSQFLKKWENSESVGLVGVACVLNLLSGGYEMRKLNIKSQCVFLDYCGCSKHWDSEGISTNINLNQLKRILAD